MATGIGESFVTDNQQWQPPAGDAEPSQPAYGQYAPQPQYGQYAAPQHGPGVPLAGVPSGVPAPGVPAPGPQAQGWAPPPKPGLIPLRPLTLGDILGAAFKTLRRNPKPTFGMSLLLQGLVMVITLVVMGAVTVIAISRTEMASPEDADAVAAGATATILLSAIIPFLFSLVASGLMQGIVVLEVARGTLGEKLTFRQLWALAKGRLWALIGWVLLVTVVVLVAATAVVLGIIALATQFGDAGLAIGILIGILAVLGAVVLWAWLSTKLALVPSALMIERRTLRQAMARSWQLTGGYFWRTFGILLLVAVILNVASQIVSTPVSIVFSLIIPMMTVGGDPTAALIGAAVTYLALVAVTLVITAITLVVQGAATALVYLDLRIRKEGLDLDLTRFVEARQVGDTSVADPLQVAGEAGAAGAPGGGSPWA